MQTAAHFIAEAWAELAVGIFFILLRLYFRFSQVGLRGMMLDDFLMILAGVIYTIETLAAHLIVAVWRGGDNNQYDIGQREELARWGPETQKYRFAVNGSKGHIVGWFMYTGMIWTLKACWTIYYSRMTNGVRKMDLRIKVAWLLNGSTYIAAVCMILFKCWPLHRQWQIYPDPGNNCYPGASKLNVSFITALNAVTDVYLMAIPIPIIYKAKLDLKKKLSLFVLFSGGWIVIIFGILRCVTLVTVAPTQPSESGQWSVRESFVAILVSNAPMVFPLLKNTLKYTLDLSSSGSRTAGSFPLQDYAQSKSKSQSRKTGFKHPLSIPMDTVATAWASDEAINKVSASVEESTKSGDEGGRPFSGERGSKNGGRGGGGGQGVGRAGEVGAMQIVKTREYKVTEE